MIIHNPLCEPLCYLCVRRGGLCVTYNFKFSYN